MLLLHQTKNVSSTLSKETLQGRIDKRHHPVLVLKESLDAEQVEQVIICRGAEEKRTINHFISDKWVTQDHSYSTMLERKVHVLRRS